MIANKLAKTIFTGTVLLAGSFLTVFLYFWALAIGAMKGYCDVHMQK
ncbi:hypothetical protein EZS27_021617 [termite gut metagenome]|uniref:Uncharacterized protein n=1 Tax=termite gut metagenome TaxID=433724 RepID=A0A5J4R625_9ZZZZ